jgi:hypothetical protein
MPFITLGNSPLTNNGNCRMTSIKSKRILEFIARQLGFVDLVWLLVIVAAITTGFFLRLLWHANNIKAFLSWEYIVTIDNIAQLGFTVFLSLSLYVLVRVLNGFSD